MKTVKTETHYIESIEEALRLYLDGHKLIYGDDKVAYDEQGGYIFGDDCFPEIKESEIHGMEWNVVFKPSEESK